MRPDPNIHEVIMQPATEFGSNAVWWMENGQLMIIFIDSAPKSAPKATGSKCPGGMAKENETASEAARRETEEETGLKIKTKANLIEVHRVDQSDNHTKVGFVTPKGLTRNYPRKTPFEDGKSIIYKVYPILLEEALVKVYKTETNPFHYDFLVAVRKHLYLKLGIPL